MDVIELIKPDDWHIHLRNGAALETTVPHAAQQFSRVAVMPNLLPPVTDSLSAINYRNDILNVAKKYNYHQFEPLMILYLTDNLAKETLIDAIHNSAVFACKLYPQGATTNSAHGVTHIKKIYPLLEIMQKENLPILIHGEVTDHDIDIFDREAIFIENVLQQIRIDFPELKITFEHITTKHAVEFVMAHKKNTAATITPHHLLLNRNDLLAGGIRPHYYCLPILKAREHQLAIQQAALSGEPCFFIGSDSAPHRKTKKESACGCAGIYHGPNTILFYTEFFAQNNALDKLEAFVSFYGADFYNFPRNQEKIVLRKKSTLIPEFYNYEDESILPLFHGGTLSWSY